jgi:hypothetical protein
MHISGLAVAAAFALLAFQEPALKSASVDFSKVDRTIKKLPKYVGEPLYALLLLGPEGKTRIWMALDKSKESRIDYDILYIDRDGDGELGEEGERIAGAADEHDRTVMLVGKVEFAEAKLLLENFKVIRYPKETPPMNFVSFTINGKVRMTGGYGNNDTYLKFKPTLDEAPILLADPWGPLSFHHAGPDELKVGQEETVMLYVGNRGSGFGSFTAVDEDFLDLSKDKIIVTLIAKDREGKKFRQRTQLKEHC